MEHRLVLGGEQFLPFARSRIKALRATGLPYADQSFEIDGVSIKVRIEPGHEYIRLEGGVKILSGAIRDGLVVDVPAVPPASPKKQLRSYRPTQNTWEKVLAKNPALPTTEFSDIGYLSHAGTQYANLAPSMFSGLMTKVVAVVMGRGLEVLYDYRWDRCHGVILDADGRPWLVEISRDNGVVAMRLPVDIGREKSSVDAEREIVKLLGGVPSGASFPKGEKFNEALRSGKVLRLTEAADMAPYFDKLAFSKALGWSFNNTGSEAHNTCWNMPEGTAERTSYHYKLDISITPTSKTNPGSAQLSLVEQGALYTYLGKTRFAFANPDTLKFDAFPASPTPYGAVVSAKTPILVCHVDGALDVVRLGSRAGTPDIDEVTDNRIWYVGTHSVHYQDNSESGQWISSDTFPHRGRGDYNHADSVTSIQKSRIAGGGNSLDILLTTTTTFSSGHHAGESAGVWPLGTRDGYIIYDPGGHSNEGLTGGWAGAEYTSNTRSEAVYTRTDWEVNPPVSYVNAFVTTRTVDPTPFSFGGWPTGEMAALAYNDALYALNASFQYGGPQTPDPWITEWSRPLSTPNGVSVITPQKTGISKTLGFSVGSLNDIYASQFWANPAGGDALYLVCNVFGTAAAFTYPATYAPGVGSPCMLEGSFFSGEASPSSKRFNFIGYIK